MGTCGHHLPFHLARAGPRLVGEAHTAQAQGRNCPQMRKASRGGLIWEEEDPRDQRNWERGFGEG